MTPKEKAEDIYNKMVVDLTIEKAQSRACALVCVDALIEHGEPDDVNYWKAVKQELEKL